MTGFPKHIETDLKITLDPNRPKTCGECTFYFEHNAGQYAPGGPLTMLCCLEPKTRELVSSKRPGCIWGVKKEADEQEWRHPGA